MRRTLLCTAALTAAALKPAITRRGWCTGAAAAITSLAPQVASADGVGPGMFVETKNMASNPDASLSRDPMNSNVLFSQDFYFKYGRSPPFLQDATSEIPDGGAVPFTRVQQRYEAYGKYAARVLAGVEAFRALKGAVDNGSWATVASDDTKYNLRAMGLLANGLMASENNGPGNVLFLTRWYVNECALDIGDVAKAADKGQAAAAWERGRKAINSALIVLTCVEIKFYDAADLHVIDATPARWRGCRFLTARPSRDGRGIAEKGLGEELSGSTWYFHAGAEQGDLAEGRGAVRSC